MEYVYLNIECFKIKCFYNRVLFEIEYSNLECY